MSDNELKPCPFCGRKVGAYFNGAREMASCTNCYEEWEISAWQSRPIEDDLRREVARLTTENQALREAARWVPFPANEPPYESSDRGLEFLCQMSWRYEYAVWPLEYFNGRFYSIDSHTNWTDEVIAFQPLPKAPAPPEGEA